MGKLQQIERTAWTAGGPDATFAVLADEAAWARWSPVDTSVLERPGAADPHGVGAIRRFRTGRITSREEVVEFEPGRRFAYMLLSGLPLRGYTAVVELRAQGGGTEIRWRSTFRPKVPGTGWLYRRALDRFIARLVAALVDETSAGAPLTAPVQDGSAAPR